MNGNIKTVGDLRHERIMESQLQRLNENLEKLIELLATKESKGKE